MARTDERAGGGPRWPLFALGAAHLAGCLYYFPPQEIFSGEPLLTGDYVFHYLEASRVAGYLRTGSFLGYCTTWAAGFPDGFLGMVNSKPFSLALALSAEATRPLVFNLAVLSSLWLFAVFLYAAARGFGFDRWEAAAATALGLSAWYGSTLFRVFWRGGSVLFVTGSAAALWAASLLLRLWTTEPTRSLRLRAALSTSLVPWIHPGAALTTVLAAGAAYAATFRSRGLRATDLLTIGAVTVALNLPWLWPFVGYRDLQPSIAHPIYPGGLENLLFDFLRGPLHLGARPPVEVSVLLPLLALAAFTWPSLGVSSPRAATLASLALLLAAIAYAGGRFAPLGALQPYRFTVPLALTLSLVAAPIVRLPFLYRNQRSATVLGCLLLLVLADRVRAGSRASDYMGSGLGIGERSALSALRRLASPTGGRIEGRVLLEGDWMTEPVAGRTHALRVSYSFVGFERYIAGEFIGAPLMAATTREEEVSFWRGRLLGRPLESYERESFLRLCELYDVRWVVSLHDETRRKLEGFSPEVERLAAEDGISVFRVRRDPMPLWRGSGKVTSDGSRIEFTTSVPEAAVLKYHWNRLLVSAPDAEIHPAAIDRETPADFVEIVPPAAGAYSIGLRGAR